MNKVKSLNRLSNFSSSTRILIVGTLTPPEGMAHGYFYSSCRAKRIYRMLDNALGISSKENESLSLLIQTLIVESDQEKKETIVAKINKKLSDNGIAFFDTVNEAYRKDPLSPKDSDLVDVSYSCSFYNERFANNIKLYIFTSELAECWFRQHIDENTITEKNSYIWSLRKGHIVDEALFARIRAEVAAYQRETK